MKNLIYIAIFLLSVSPIYSQEIEEPKETINWVSISEVEKLTKENPKKIFIDIYTNWCGWCKRMERTTFQNPYIVKYVNENFYSVKLNAETRDTIIYRKMAYAFNPNFKTNQLAVSLMDARMGYPTTVYLDEKLKKVGRIASFLSVKKFEAVINYYNKEEYKNMTWEKYEKSFESQIPDEHANAPVIKK